MSMWKPPRKEAIFCSINFTYNSFVHIAPIESKCQSGVFTLSVLRFFFAAAADQQFASSSARASAAAALDPTMMSVYSMETQNDDSSTSGNDAGNMEPLAEEANANASVHD